MIYVQNRSGWRFFERNKETPAYSFWDRIVIFDRNELLKLSRRKSKTAWQWIYTPAGNENWEVNETTRRRLQTPAGDSCIRKKVAVAASKLKQEEACNSALAHTVPDLIFPLRWHPPPFLHHTPAAFPQNITSIKHLPPHQQQPTQGVKHDLINHITLIKTTLCILSHRPSAVWTLRSVCTLISTTSNQHCPL